MIVAVVCLLAANHESNGLLVRTMDNQKRCPAVDDHTGCQRPSKSSKIDDFHFI